VPQADRPAEGGPGQDRDQELQAQGHGSEGQIATGGSA